MDHDGFNSMILNNVVVLFVRLQQQGQERSQTRSEKQKYKNEMKYDSKQLVIPNSLSAV